MSLPERYDNDGIRSVYEGFARWYGVEAAVSDRLFGVGALRQAVVGRARGRVLDVACGSGQNFAALAGSDAESVVAVDLTPQMLQRAGRRATDVGLQVDLREGDAQALTFEDASFDTVCSSLSMCTFPDPVAALAEMARVLRPGGEVLLVEHGRSSAAWFARFQDWRADGHYKAAACRWTQAPQALVTEAGLRITWQRTRTLGIFVGMVCQPA